jgi:hypothetical protein
MFATHVSTKALSIAKKCSSMQKKLILKNKILKQLAVLYSLFL